MTADQEQLRRLKNTLMGAGHRLELLAADPKYPAELRDGLHSLALQLRGTVASFDRLLRSYIEDRS